MSTATSPNQHALINQALEPFGASVDASGLIHKGIKTTGIQCVVTLNRRIKEADSL